MQQQSQQPQQYTPSSIPSSNSANVTYQQSSDGNSSIHSGSQFNRVPNVSSTSSPTVNVTSSQAQIFFNSAPQATTNIRIGLENYSIVSLQPASISHQGQPIPTAQAIKNQMVPHKIVLHSVPVSDGSHKIANTSLAPAAATALISLNPDFAQANQVSLGHLPTLNNGPTPSSTPNTGVKQNNNLPTGSIILSPIIQNSNIPVSQVTRGMTNFAVPIPVVTSAIADQRPQNVTIQLSSTGQFVPSTVAFAPSVSQSTLVTNLVPNIGSTHATALATKSTKMPLSTQVNKTASKSVNSTTTGTKSSSASTGSSSMWLLIEQLD